MKVGIIGGGHFWRAWDTEYSLREVSTPYGPPADSICTGVVDGHEVFTLQRHGPRHELSPGSIPWRENAFAIAMCGVDFVIHVTACGALTDDYGVGDIALLGQLIDFTRSRPTTLGPPVLAGVTHLTCAEPFDPELTAQAATRLDDVRADATMVTIEGPRFSTLAESRMFRAWGADLVNMTSAPEVFLLAELGLRVIGLGLVTDMDTDAAPSDRVSVTTITGAVLRYRDRVPLAVRSILDAVEVSAPDRDRGDVGAISIDELDLRPATTPERPRA
jgi:5'-methylthioadenosine phosphorylase